MTSVTSQRIFSALRRLKNYLRSTKKQDPLNNYLLMHSHKSITDTIGTVRIVERFACAVEKQKKAILENLSRGMRMAEWKMSTPPPPPFQNALPQLLWLVFA